MKIIRAFLLFLFSTLVAIKIYFRIMDNPVASPFLESLLLLLAFITVVVCKRQFAWFLGLLLFGYGLYYYYFKSAIVSEPGMMDFTYPLNVALFGVKGRNRVIPFINLFPFLFYCIGTITLFTKPARRYYQIIK